MPEIRDIGVFVTQELAPTAPAPATPVQRQVISGVNRQIITKKKAGLYANVQIEIPLVDLLATSVLDDVSVQVFIKNHFGEFEILVGTPLTDLKSFSIGAGEAGTILPAYLRVSRTSQLESKTGALALVQGTIRQALLAGPVTITVSGNVVTVPGANFGTVVAGDLLELNDGGHAGVLRRFRASAPGSGTAFTAETLNPDAVGALANGASVTNVTAYQPIYKFTDINAKFVSNSTRPIDDAQASGSKLYPQPGDTFSTPSTFKGLYAFVVLAGTKYRIMTWAGNINALETEIILDPTNVALPLSVVGSNITYTVVTEEPATGRISGVAADVIQSYKALRKDKLGIVNSVLGPADALAQFGPADDDNPLGLAAFLAATINSATAVYVVQAEADTLVGHATALDAISKVRAYHLCPVTSQKAVADAYVAQATNLSVPTARKVRVAYFNLPVPQRLVPVDLGSVTVTVTSSPNTLTLAGASFLTAGVTAGQLVEFNDPTASTVGALRQFFVTHVVDADTVQVGSLNPDALGTVTTGVKNNVKVVSANFTAEQKKDAMVSLAQGYTNRRARLISPDKTTLNVAGVTVVTDGKYWGSLIGAMYAAREPGTPISTLEVPLVLSVSGSWDVFTAEQIREMRSAGVFQIIQELEGAPPIIDHQVTTDTRSKKVQEPSFTHVVDSLDEGLRQTLNPLFGKANLNKEFLLGLSLAIDGFFKSRKENRRQIDGYLVLEVGRSTVPGLEDSVAVRVQIDVPPVANNADVTFII